MIELIAIFPIPDPPFTKSWGPISVPTDLAIALLSSEPSSYDIRKVTPYLAREGLIEPLKMDASGTIGKIDPWDNARLKYCMLNNWSTVIIAYEHDQGQGRKKGK